VLGNLGQRVRVCKPPARIQGALRMAVPPNSGPICYRLSTPGKRSRPEGAAKPARRLATGRASVN